MLENGGFSSSARVQRFMGNYRIIVENRGKMNI